ncbi:hypothetical protein V2G26_010527 [Clonostachys chloroleuca]
MAWLRHSGNSEPRPWSSSPSDTGNLYPSEGGHALGKFGDRAQPKSPSGTHNRQPEAAITVRSVFLPTVLNKPHTVVEHSGATTNESVCGGKQLLTKNPIGSFLNGALIINYIPEVRIRNPVVVLPLRDSLFPPNAKNV